MGGHLGNFPFFRPMQAILQMPVPRQIGRFLGVELLSFQVDVFKILMHVSKSVLIHPYNIYTVNQFS